MVRDYSGMEEDSSGSQGPQQNVVLDKKKISHFYTHTYFM